MLKQGFFVRIKDKNKQVWYYKGIVVALEELKNTVKVLYGINADTDCYLKKFVDVEYLLPKPNLNVFIKYLIENKYKIINEKYEFFNQKQSILIKNHRNEWHFTYINEKNYLSKVIAEYTQDYSLQLRDIEKILLKFSIIINFLPETNALCLPFLIDLIIINRYYPNIYNYIRSILLLLMKI